MPLVATYAMPGPLEGPRALGDPLVILDTQGRERARVSLTVDASGAVSVQVQRISARGEILSCQTRRVVAVYRDRKES